MVPKSAMRLMSPASMSDARGDGHHRHVAVRHVAEFVSQDGLELFVVEPLHQSARGTDHGVTRATSGGEGVGYVHLGDAHAGLLHVGEQAQPVDDLVKLGLLLGRDLVRVHREHRDLVREEVLREKSSPPAMTITSTSETPRLIMTDTMMA